MSSSLPTPASDRPRLWFERVAIAATPGIRAPYELADLTPGITVLFGPNGIGKSSTATSMLRLLWAETHRAGAEFRVEGSLRLDDARWRIEHDRFGTRYEREGADVAQSPLGALALEMRDRYVLSLHDLLRVNDEAFAQVIQRESAGGYDLDAAATVLNYRTGVPGGRRNIPTALREAKTAYRLTTDRQLALAREVEQLDDLHTRAQRAAAASVTASELTDAIRYATAIAALDRATATLAEFPPTLALLTGEEPARARQLREELAETDRERTGTANARASRLAARDAAGLPDAAVITAELAAARALTDRLLRLEDSHHTLAIAAANATARRDEIRRRLDPALTEAQLTAFDLTAAAAYLDAVRKLTGLHAQQAAMDQIAQWLGEVVPPAPDALAAGVDHLARIRGLLVAASTGPSPAAAPASTGRSWLVWASVAVAVVAIVAGAVLGPPVLGALLILPVILAVLAWRQPAPVPDAGPLPALIADYARFGLPTPAGWTLPAVDATLTSLMTDQRVAAVEAEKWTRWQGLAGERAALAAETATVEAALAAQPPGFTTLADPDQHRRRLELVRDWQVASRDQAAALAEQATVATQRAGIAADLTTRLHATPPIVTGADATAVVKARDEQVAAWRDANAAVERATQALANLDQTAARATADLTSLYARLDQPVPLDDRALTALAQQLPAYQEAVQRQTAAEGSVEQALTVARDEQRVDAATLALPLAELTSRRDAATAAAAGEAALRADITRIETRRDAATTQREGESAYAAVQAAERRLRDLRDEETRLALGNVLAETISRQSQDFSRPQVFHTARDLLSQFTHGHYRLQLDPATATFFAQDTIAGHDRRLDELSSGTRVQLLMAVRLAFVESMETGPRLPIFIDEALANTDDERAIAIIETAAALGAAGRQVFYLTAQQVEVERWRAVLGAGATVPFRVIDLAALRGQSRQAQPAALNLTLTPGPDWRETHPGATRVELRRLMAVAPVDPWAPDLGHVDLWYLVPAVDQLRALRHLRIHSWGQLRTVAEIGGRQPLPAVTAALPIAAAHERALAQVVRLWRQGRGAPVEAAVLAASDAVSERFLSRVSDLARELQGDGPRLIEALRRGRLRSFRLRQVDELERYLAAAGYLATNRLLTPDEIYHQAAATVADDLAAGWLTPATLDELIASLAPAAQTPQREV